MSDPNPPSGTPAATPPAPVAPPAPAKPAEEKLFRVGGGTDCKRLAAAIAGSIDNEGIKPVLEYIGAGAGAQAIKAVAIANTFLSRKGKYATVLPTFVHRAMPDNEDTTGMQLRLIVHTIS